MRQQAELWGRSSVVLHMHGACVGERPDMLGLHSSQLHRHPFLPQQGRRLCQPACRARLGPVLGTRDMLDARRAPVRLLRAERWRLRPADPQATTSSCPGER